MVERAVLVPTDGLPMQDNHHFNMAGHKQWAECAFELLAQKNLLPWATAR